MACFPERSMLAVNRLCCFPRKDGHSMDGTTSALLCSAPALATLLQQHAATLPDRE
jgi:hypothetical protein